LRAPAAAFILEGAMSTVPRRPRPLITEFLRTFIAVVEFIVKNANPLPLIETSAVLLF
jgi:hypothetical protein